MTAAAVTVIAGSQLAHLYSIALAAVGCGNVQQIDSDVAVVRGLWRIWGLRGSAE
jgi:2-keto-3-deoxy-galactonokinase